MAALARVPGMRYADILQLNFESARDLTSRSLAQAGLLPRLAEAVPRAVQDFDYDSWEERNARAGCQALVIGEPAYPSSLLDLYAPPLIIYCRGTLASLKRVAVVGTRTATAYGRQLVETFVPLLVDNNFTVVSGLAKGIDTFAHETTLRMGGHTIAVLGTGVDTMYPRENTRLAWRIVESGGALLSEYPPGTPPLRHHFPERNRLISGLSMACLVAEGDRKSGALITALHALEQGREVLAVPGNIFSPQSRGPNYLISQGATPLTDPAVLLQTLGVQEQRGQERRARELGIHAGLVMLALGSVACSVDDLGLYTKLAMPELLAALTELELEGTVLRLPTGQYICQTPPI